MKYTQNTAKYIAFGVMTLTLVLGVVIYAPRTTQACIKALGFLDPTCVVSGKVSLPSLPGISSTGGTRTTNTTVNNTNSYNTNSTVGSTITNPGTVVYPQPIAYTTPVYNYNTYPTYNYPQYNNQGPLQATCYPMPLSARAGDNTSWVASAYGGNGSYYFTWTGTDGLSGYGSSISKTYYASGYKYASVTVTSGGQTVSKNCDGSINVTDGYYNNGNNYPYNYYSPLSVTCSATVYNNNYANSAVTWYAYPSGGNGSYSYSWSGTDGLYGSSQSVYYAYSNPGVKYATVTIYSNGQSMTQSCSSINVGTVYNNYPNYNYTYNSNSGLDVACYTDPVSARVNQPVTWRSEVTGGSAPYTYSWTGTNDLSGSDSSVIKYYSTTGDKSAIVTIRSADGKSATRACSTSLNVRSASTVTAARPTTQVVKPPTQVQDDSPLSAAALFSLKNVPWGLVAILIILVLFGTVLYLLFNKKEI